MVACTCVLAGSSTAKGQAQNPFGFTPPTPSVLLPGENLEVNAGVTYIDVNNDGLVDIVHAEQAAQNSGGPVTTLNTYLNNGCEFVLSSNGTINNSHPLQMCNLPTLQPTALEDPQVAAVLQAANQAHHTHKFANHRVTLEMFHTMSRNDLSEIGVTAWADREALVLASRPLAADHAAKQDLQQFLEPLGLGRFVVHLLAEDVDLTMLVGLSEVDLEKAGVGTVGARKKIVAAAAAAADTTADAAVPKQTVFPRPAAPHSPPAPPPPVPASVHSAPKQSPPTSATKSSAKREVRGADVDGGSEGSGGFLSPPVISSTFRAINTDMRQLNQGVTLMDLNDDGLVDFMQSFNDDETAQHSLTTYLNNGCEFVNSSTINASNPLKMCSIPKQEEHATEDARVTAILAAANMGHYAVTLANHQVDLVTFGALTDADLERMGVAAVGARKVLLNASRIERRRQLQQHALAPLFTPCPSVDAFPYALPTSLGYAFVQSSNALVGGAGSQYSLGQFIDLNGDQLPDLVYGILEHTDFNPDSNYRCIYLNNGCGWVNASTVTPKTPLVYQTCN
jgi:hypothetical protein